MVNRCMMAESNGAQGYDGFFNMYGNIQCVAFVSVAYVSEILPAPDYISAPSNGRIVQLV